MEKRFGILRFIGTVYKIFGVILAVITVLAVLGVCLTSILGGAAFEELMYQMDMGGMGWLGGALGGIVASIAILLGLGSAAITQYAIGEAIFLFLSMEENTRKTAMLLQQRSAE